MQLFDAAHNRLVYTGTPPTTHYWESLWKQKRNIQQALANTTSDPLIPHLTRRFIGPPNGQKILDGGCGIGQHVARLHQLGYQAYGIDNDAKTVEEINKLAPHLSIQHGDVKALPYPSDFFDGYWSIGLIEHWTDGYLPCAQEMHRVLKPDGYLFLTFPQMSPLRKIKTRFNRYPHLTTKIDQTTFYQFALDPDQVSSTFQKIGFHLVYKTATAGFKGFKDESGPLKPLLQKLYDSPYRAAKALKVSLSWLLEPIAGHSAVLVLQKKKP